MSSTTKDMFVIRRGKCTKEKWGKDPTFVIHFILYSWDKSPWESEYDQGFNHGSLVLVIGNTITMRACVSQSQVMFHYVDYNYVYCLYSLIDSLFAIENLQLYCMWELQSSKWMIDWIPISCVYYSYARKSDRLLPFSSPAWRVSCLNRFSISINLLYRLSLRESIEAWEHSCA